MLHNKRKKQNELAGIFIVCLWLIRLEFCQSTYVCMSRASFLFCWDILRLSTTFQPKRERECKKVILIYLGKRNVGEYDKQRCPSTNGLLTLFAYDINFTVNATVLDNWIELEWHHPITPCNLLLLLFMRIMVFTLPNHFIFIALSIIIRCGGGWWILYNNNKVHLMIAFDYSHSKAIIVKKYTQSLSFP